MSFRNQPAILEAKDPILLAYDILDTRRQPGIVKGGFAKLRGERHVQLPANLLRSAFTRTRSPLNAAAVGLNNPLPVSVCRTAPLEARTTGPDPTPVA